MDVILGNLAIPIENDGPEAYLEAAAQRLALASGEIAIATILSKALDVSCAEQFYYKLALVVHTPADFVNTQGFPVYREPARTERPISNSQERPLIVGFGPAGMFAALELLAHGLKPIIFERGKRIEERSKDVQRFIAERRIDAESNIQFGEGGAGSYSDGKLFSRRNSNSGFVNRVLETFIRFGAPAEIAYISKPHLGTDVLRAIVRNIREHILERGGEIHYGAKMTDLLLAQGKAAGVVINNEREYLSSTIYLALGHSARDSFAMLHERGVALERKPIAVGVRIEHPADTINLLRHGAKYKDFPGLGAATYSFNYTNRERCRGVYTFCMCPGGEVINASSEPGLMVVNGMSYSHRASPFSNAALVVTCHVDDYPGSGPLAGVAFQQEIERRSFAAGGGSWAVPAQNLLTFMGEKGATGLHDHSYRMGAVAADLHEIFPGFVGNELTAAFRQWQGEVPLFVSSQAILLGAETRTSSPVRISRNDSFESINTKNLYPLGEGAGYSGGITSSAADAIRAVAMRWGGRSHKA